MREPKNAVPMRPEICTWWTARGGTPCLQALQTAKTPQTQGPFHCLALCPSLVSAAGQACGVRLLVGGQPVSRRIWAIGICCHGQVPARTQLSQGAPLLSRAAATGPRGCWPLPDSIREVRAANTTGGCRKTRRPQGYPVLKSQARIKIRQNKEEELRRAAKAHPKARVLLPVG